MANILSNLEAFFKQKNILTRLIIINIVAFLLIRLSVVIATLFNVEGWSLLQYLDLPSYIPQLIKEPWTLLSYAFVHFEFLHILFNLLWLYWFGQIFLLFFNEKQLLGVYLLGAFSGALFYVSSYNIFPLFSNVVTSSWLIGASASVMAVVFAASFYKKDYRINLLFIGSIKIYYVALISLLLDMLAITSSNAGGHWAHIGGALFGICFALCYQKGKDLVAPLNRCLDWVVNLFKKKPVMRVTYQKRESDYRYNEMKNRKTQDLDDILDKVKKSGFDSLTKDEKRRLFDASNK